MIQFKQLKKQGGFTLLELSIVIVIIGILALLIIPNVISSPKKARDTQRKTDLRAIQKGLEEYFATNDVYPDSSGVVSAVLGGSNGPLTSGPVPIMKTMPTDPKNLSPFHYLYASGNRDTTYTLTACLENDQDSSTNVIAPVSPCLTKTFELVNGS